MNYFRITAYKPEDDYCFIIDSNGMFEKKWEFSSYLIQRGFKVLEISNDDEFLDVNIEKVEQDKDHMLLRAISNGKPNYIQQTLNNISYKAVSVADKVYIPNKEII